MGGSGGASGPTTGARSRGRAAGRGGAVVLAAVVVLVAVALVALGVTLVVLDDGWTRVIWTALGALLLWQLVPRPVRISSRAVVVARQDGSALHRLVDDVAGAAGVRAPSAVAVDTVYPTTLVATGYLGRATLVLGLPQWSALDDDERLAVLTHELACAAPTRTAGGCLVRLADDLVGRLLSLLAPTAAVQPHESARQEQDAGLGALGAGDDLAGARMRREATAAVGNAGLSAVGGPVRALQLGLRRAARPAAERACLAADGLAVGLVGVRPVVAMLLSTLPVARGLSAANAAARQKADPFAAMAGAGRPAAEELEQRLAVAESSRATMGPRHAPTATRVRAVRASTEVATARVDRALVVAADRELAPHRERLARQLTEELVHGR